MAVVLGGAEAVVVVVGMTVVLGGAAVVTAVVVAGAGAVVVTGECAGASVQPATATNTTIRTVAARSVICVPHGIDH